MRQLVAVLAVATGFLTACAGPGAQRPGSPAHHLERGFRNLNPDYARPGFWVRWAFFFRRAWTTTFRPRTAALPRLENDGHTLRSGSTEPRVTWVGHSTLLVQLDGVNLLTDPQWSDRASPLPFAGPRRLTPPGLRLEDLPPIALVLILMGMSHTTPEEALRIFADVGAARLLAIHWGTFDLADEPIQQPAERLAAEAARRGLSPDRIWIPKAGETRSW